MQGAAPRTGITFAGPQPEILELFGDKAKARALAASCGVPLLAGTNFPTGAEEAKAFLASLGDGGAIMIKAIAGGGGRGMRAVTNAEEVEAAFARCQSEALKAFGNGDLYVEQLAANARHIEIQIIGDGKTVIHLGERDCSIQRQHQKIVEIAPGPGLPQEMRDRLTSSGPAHGVRKRASTTRARSSFWCTTGASLSWRRIRGCK